MLTPPNAGWEENLEAAFDAGALDAVAEVLTLHKGDENVMNACNSCLAAMATKPHMARAMVEKGVLATMLEGVIENPDAEGADTAMELLDRVSDSCPEALLEAGFADVVARLMTSTSRPEHKAICARTLERINKCPGGSQALIDAGCVPPLLELITEPVDYELLDAQMKVTRSTATHMGRRTAEEEEEDRKPPALKAVESTFRLLDRICRSGDHAGFLRDECRGMELVSEALEVHEPNTKVCKIGGRILNKLARGNVEGLIRRMEGCTDDKERDFLASLLANLALEDDAAEKIVAAGGIPAFIKCFSSTSPKTIIAAARGLGRIAGLGGHAVEALLANGTVGALVEALQRFADNPEVVAAILPALRRLATTPEAVAEVASRGGVEAVVALLKDNPDNALIVDECLAVLESLAVQGYDVDQLVPMGAIPAIAAGMKGCDDKDSIQLNGIRCFIYLANSEANLESIVMEDAIELVCAAMANDDNKALVKAALYLATSMCLVPENLEFFKEFGAVDSLLSAIARFARSDPDVRAFAQELMEAMVTEEEVNAIVGQVRAAKAALLASKSEDDAQVLSDLIAKMGAFAIVTSNAELILESGGAGVLTETLTQISPQKGIPLKEDILTNCSMALCDLARAVTERPDLQETLGASGAVPAVIQAIKGHPKLKDHVKASVKLLEIFSQFDSCVGMILGGGGIEACCAAIRANPRDVEVVDASVHTLLRLAAAEGGAVALARHGACRQIIANIMANTGTPGFHAPMTKMLQVIACVAMESEGASTLMKQNAIPAIIAAAEYLGLEGGVALEALSRLLTRDDVHGAIQAVKEAEGSFGRLINMDIAALEAVLPAIATVGRFAQVGTFGSLIVEEGGAAALQSMLATTLHKCDDAEKKRLLLPTLVAAVARLAGSVDLDPSLGLDALVHEAFASGLAVKECLMYIKGMASRGEDAAYRLATDGQSVECALTALKEHGRDKAVARLAFEALGALSGYASTAPIIAGSAAPRLVTDWIDDHMDDARPEDMQAALDCLTAMTISPAEAAAINSLGMNEVAKNIITRFVQDADVPSPEVMCASLQLLTNLGAEPDAVRAQHRDGLLRRICKAAASDALIDDPNAMQALLNFFTHVITQCPELKGELEAMGAPGIIMAAMNANSTSEAVLAAGAACLKALGVGPKLALQVADEVDRLAAVVEAADPITQDMIDALGLAVQQLANFLSIDGVVTPENVGRLLQTVSNAVGLLAESGIASESILASAVTAVGRLAARGGDDEKVEAVNLVLDTLELCGHMPKVVEACVHTLGLLTTNPQALRAMCELGALDTLLDIARRNPHNAKLLELINATIAKIAEIAKSNAANLVMQPGGIEALMAVIKANAKDASTLAAFIADIAASPGGTDALWKLLQGTEDVPMDIMSEILHALAAMAAAGGPGSLITLDAAQVGLLGKAMKAALDAQLTLAEGDARGMAIAQATMESALDLLSMCENLSSADLAAALAAAGGIKAALQMLSANLSDPETVAKIMGILSKAALSMDPASLADLARGMKGIENTAKLYLEGAEVDGLKLEPNPGIVGCCISTMHSVAAGLGAEASNISRDGMRTTMIALDEMASEPNIAEFAPKLADLMQEKFSDEPVRLLDTRLDTAVGALSTLGAITMMIDPTTGKPYWINTETGERYDSPPEGYESAYAAVMALADACGRMEKDAVPTVAESMIKGLVGALATHSGSSDMASAIAAALQTLGLNGKNLDAIAQNGGIEAIIKAIRDNPDNAALLLILLTLLERISRKDQYKEHIATAGGIDVVINIAIAKHVGHREITLKSLAILANLAFNHPPNIDRIMEAEGVKAIESTMQQWVDDPRVLENAMCALSNLMHGSEDNKLIIGRTCGDEIVAIIARHFKDVNLFKMALRAVGNLSICDENIQWMAVEHHATQEIVKGMKEHDTDEEALQLSMEVIGNFASLEEDEEAIEEDPDYVTISAQIYKEQGSGTIMHYMQEHKHNSAVLKCALNAMANICNDVETTDLIGEHQGINPTVVEIMQTHDWDEDLIASVTPLVATLTYSDICLEALLALDIVPLLLTAMDSHGINSELLNGAQLALTNLCADAGARDQIRNLNGVTTILGLMEGHIADVEYCSEAINTLTRLCGEDDLSSKIAEDGMHVIMKACDKHSGDPDFLTNAFRLLGHLAFVESNLPIIVQFDGIQKVIQAICTHPDSQSLMVRSIQTVDNIAMASKENCQIVIDEGGKELVETIMESYPDDPEIQKYGKSAILSMNALENLNKSASLDTQGRGRAKEDDVDPLKSVRNMLSAGQVLKVWTKGTPKTCHVLASTDFRSMVWQDPKKKTKLGAMDLRSVMQIRAGKGEGHKKKAFSRVAANEELCFSVIGERTSLDCEVTVKPDVKKWVDALNLLLKVYKTNPGALTRGAIA